MPTAEEKEYRTAFLATLRRIADALDSIAGVLAEAARLIREGRAGAVLGKDGVIVAPVSSLAP